MGTVERASIFPLSLEDTGQGEGDLQEIVRCLRKSASGKGGSRRFPLI